MIPGPDCGHPCQPRAECCTPDEQRVALDELVRLSEEMGLYDR